VAAVVKEIMVRAAWWRWWCGEINVVPVVGGLGDSGQKHVVIKRAAEECH